MTYMSFASKSQKSGIVQDCLSEIFLFCFADSALQTPTSTSTRSMPDTRRTRSSRCIWKPQPRTLFWVGIMVIGVIYVCGILLPGGKLGMPERVSIQPSDRLPSDEGHCIAERCVSRIIMDVYYASFLSGPRQRHAGVTPLTRRTYSELFVPFGSFSGWWIHVWYAALTHKLRVPGREHASVAQIRAADSHPRDHDENPTSFVKPGLWGQPPTGTWPDTKWSKVVGWMLDLSALGGFTGHSLACCT